MLTRAQRVARPVQSDQRRGTRGIDRYRRALQPECVSDPARYHAPSAARTQIALQPSERLARKPTAIVVVHHTREHPSLAAPQFKRVKTLSLIHISEPT